MCNHTANCITAVVYTLQVETISQERLALYEVVVKRDLMGGTKMVSYEWLENRPMPWKPVSKDGAKPMRVGSRKGNLSNTAGALYFNSSTGLDALHSKRKSRSSSRAEL